MFRRVILENWQDSLPLIGFAIIAAVFLFITVRAALTRKEHCDRAARMPLDDDTTTNHD
jgi:hypothetical protein